MALWGKEDLVGNKGTVAINLSTGVVTGSGTTFSTSGYAAEQGDVIVVGAGATYGRAIVQSVASTTSLTMSHVDNIIKDGSTANVVGGTSYFITRSPISAITDNQYGAPDVKSNRFSGVFGVDTTEQGVARAATGSKYAAPHAGWVGVTTYVDTHGTLRVKTETLVAMSEITDAAGGRDAEDAIYPDS